MPRPKGSKNSKTAVAGTTLDQIIAAKESAAQEVENLVADIEAAKAELAEKKAALKSAQKRLAQLEADVVIAEAAEAEQQRKVEAEKLVDAILKSGKSSDEIMAMLGVNE